ncbi:MAG: rhomboid family intramembrane serine protease [Calditrichia bacterium]
MYSSSPGMNITPAIKNIILTCVAVFFFQSTLASSLNETLSFLMPENSAWYYGNVFEMIFGVLPNLFMNSFFVWQPFTYMWLHGDFWHIFFNLIIVWMFGSELERQWGTREFWRYYLFTGIAAGVTILVWNGFFAPNIPTIGASGAVFGLLAAYALFYPDNYIYFWFFLPIKTKYFVALIAVFEFFSISAADGVSHIGHIGGLIAGYFYIRHKYKREGIGRTFFQDFFKKKGHF